MVSTRQRVISHSEEGELVLNNTHNLISTPPASGLGEMHSQNGRKSDSERAGRHLLCSAIETMSMTCSMYQ